MDAAGSRDSAAPLPPTDASTDSALTPDAADLCAGVDCGALDGECVVGVCDPETGACVRSSLAEGSPCDDGNACTVDDVCTALSCAGTRLCEDPAGVVPWGPAADAGPRGPGASVSGEQTCQPHEVIVGMAGQTTGGTIVAELSPLCAPLSVVGTGAAPRTLAFGPASAVAPIGRGDTPFSAACPAGEALVGFGGRMGLAIDQLVFRCAPLTFDEATGAGVVGGASDLPAVGGLGGGPFPDAGCPAGQVATGTRAEVDGPGLNDGLVRALTLHCRPVYGVYELLSAPLSTTATLGGSGGALFEDDCPERMVPYAIEGYVVGSRVAGARARCAHLWRVGLTASPRGVLIERLGGGTTPWRGVVGTLLASCDPTEVVVGLQGHDDGLGGVGSVTVRCATVSLDGTHFSVSPPTPRGSLMAAGRPGTPFSVDCASVTSGLAGRLSGPGDLIALGIRCGSLP